MDWRWDQGRNQYFHFDNIQKIAPVLTALDGADLSTRAPDPLRLSLETQTGLEFKPDHYKVWRNHGRIFNCCMLAAKVNDRLRVTDVCRGLSSTGDDRLDLDSYLSIIIPRFAYSYPAFDDYDPAGEQVYPFCASLKLLLYGSQSLADSSMGVDDVAGRIIGNRLTGLEGEQAYRSLPDSGHCLTGDSKRQAREMLKFMSQSSFLKWQNQRLYLDIIPGDIESMEALESLATPQPGTRLADPQLEIIRLGNGIPADYDRVISVTRRQPADVVFTEGRRVRMTHLRTERSPLIRTALFNHLPQPYLCDVCGRNMRTIYPWTENILEVHHLLPLSSAIEVGERDTSLNDVVPACPNCHRSVHIYYKRYLNARVQNDFTSKEESISVYNEAKAGVRI
jgi:hypothetical protein